VTDVLRQNALYGTGAGSGDGIHVNAGKTGTTDNHADAWFDGFTKQLATVVWMGYPQGEKPMLDVHGVAVAGATFPVPIWHDYMAAALWHHKVLGFDLPDKYPTWRTLTRGSYGSFGSYYSTPSYSAPATPSTSTEVTTTHHAPAAPAPKAKPKPQPKPATTAAPPASTTPAPPPPTTTAEAPPPATTTEPLPTP
jgi:penicillin-binding protein 1A